MNVTLVYPCLRNFGGWNSLGKNREGCFILHGLPSIAACLEEKGHNVKLLDLRERHSWDDTYDWITRDNSMIYGIYMSTLDYHEAKTTAELIRKAKPNAKIIVGGPHPSVIPEVVAEDKVFDYVFAGEGEITFPDLVENPDKYPRIVHGEHPDLNKLPFEDREIFNMKKVLATKHIIFPSPFMNVISGRGCPHNCSFCKPGEDLIFGKFRMRSVDHLMGEIEMLEQKYQFNFLLIDDDLFTASTDYVYEWCDRYEKIKKPFSIQTRADWASRNIDALQRMKEVGLGWVRMGLESGNQRILNLMRKGVTVEQNVQAVENCHKIGLQVIANYMLGNPSETKAETLDTINMIKRLNIEWKSAAFYTPIVGTDLYDYCRAHKLLVSDDPAVLGTRTITEQPRLKGVDYDWIQRQMYGNYYRQRHFVRAVLNRYPVLAPLRKVASRLVK